MAGSPASASRALSPVRSPLSQWDGVFSGPRSGLRQVETPGERLLKKARSPRRFRSGRSPRRDGDLSASTIHEGTIPELSEFVEGESRSRRGSHAALHERSVPVPLVGLGRPGDGRVHAVTPSIILGCWHLSEDHRADPRDVEECFQALAYMVGRGACAVDLSIDKGVEGVLGRFESSTAFLEAQRQSGLRLRRHVNLVPDVDSLSRLDRDYVEASLKRSMRRLNISPHQPLDLVHLHWWDLQQGNYVEAARLLADFSEGQHPDGHEWLVRSIGLTNFGAKETAEILDAGVAVASVEIQLSLLDRRPLASGLLDLCAERGVSVLCYGVLAGGILSDRYLGQPEPEWMVEPELAPTKSLTKYAMIAVECGGWYAVQSLLAIMREVADKRMERCHTNVSIAQIAVAWALRQTAVAGCVIGVPHGAGDELSPGRQRAAEICETSRIDLSDVEVAAIEMHLMYITRPLGGTYALERDRSSRHGAVHHHKLSGVGEDMHGREILDAWGDAMMRITGGAHFARRCAWEAKYCLAQGRLSPEVAASLSEKIGQMEHTVAKSLELGHGRFNHRAGSPMGRMTHHSPRTSAVASPAGSRIMSSRAPGPGATSPNGSSRGLRTNGLTSSTQSLRGASAS